MSEAQRLRAQDRGLAYVLILFGFTLISVGFLWAALMGPVFTDVHSAAINQTNSSEAATGLSYTQQAWDLVPVFTGILGTIMVVSAAAQEARA